jgi:general secretion pathway protein D
MKIIQKIIILFCLSYSSLFSADLIDVSLKSFVIQVAKDKDITILIDKKIDDTLTLTVSNRIRKGDYLNALKMVLSGKNLELVKQGNIYHIQDIKKYRTVKINFAKYDDIKDLLTGFEATIKYIKNSNSLLIHSSLKEYQKIQYILRKIDIVPNQKKLKITIINTNLNNIKERGFQNDYKLSSSDNYFFNLVAYPFTVTNQIPAGSTTSFYSFIKFLNQEGYTNLLSSPTLTILDDKETLFQVVNNIPYKTSTTQNLTATTTSTTNYDYKDVGLNIKVTPKILPSNQVYLDLDLSFENVISQSETPSISKKRIKQNLILKQGEICVLTGINQDEEQIQKGGIPGLKDIPYLGWLFKYETKNTNHFNLTVLLEISDT